MAYTGMDSEQVRALAVQMRSTADQIRTLSGTLTSQLSGTQWIGADRTRFESDWQTSHVVLLNQVSLALENAATTADANANEQDAAQA